VAGRTEVLDMEAARQQLVDLVEKVLVEAYHLGLNREDIKQLFEESLDNWEKRGGK